MLNGNPNQRANPSSSARTPPRALTAVQYQGIQAAETVGLELMVLPQRVAASLEALARRASQPHRGAQTTPARVGFAPASWRALLVPQADRRRPGLRSALPIGFCGRCKIQCFGQGRSQERLPPHALPQQPPHDPRDLAKAILSGSPSGGSAVTSRGVRSRSHPHCAEPARPRFVEAIPLRQCEQLRPFRQAVFRQRHALT